MNAVTKRSPVRVNQLRPDCSSIQCESGHLSQLAAMAEGVSGVSGVPARSARADTLPKS